MIIRSTYRDSAKEQFEMEIVGECINENSEECYLVRLLPKWQNQFQEKDEITELRKCLIGAIYEIVSEERHEQLSLFEEEE